jgi:polyhydroxyalkanoate synthase
MPAGWLGADLAFASSPNATTTRSHEDFMDNPVDRAGAPLSPVKRVVPPVAPAPIPPLPASIGSENPLDRVSHASIARLAGGFSPMAIAEAAFDWALHLAVSPGRQSALALSALAKQGALAETALRPLRRRGAGAARDRRRPDDRRFGAEEWGHWPFSLYAESFLAAERWWDEAASGVHGASPHHLALLNFLGRQALDTVAPSNFLATNPVALKQTLKEGGLNLLRGAINYSADLKRLVRNERSQAEKAFKPGETVALTKGAVVARTPLAEIIQYSPTTKSVGAEPVVIAPAWIMKYYILDLRPENSLIKHLVDNGFTVFCISWRNPTSSDRGIGFDDYLSEGLLPSIDAALAIARASRAHLVGYCIGGTLAAIAAARMARDNDDRLQSLTLIAAQTDFEEAGELKLFIDDSQLALLDDVMWEQGMLEASQMAGTFDLMRSNDLIWSRAIHNYLMGSPDQIDDLSAWSSDATRMPYKMHSDYLRTLYLNNDLAEGRFRLNGRPVALRDIRAPMFVIGTERDHVAPWRSVFKIHHLAGAEITFVLVNGGHNRGVVAPPGQGDRHFRIATTTAKDPRPDPDAWAGSADYRQESWWLAWFDWLHARSSRDVAPSPLGLESAGLAPLAPAPGDYVLG